MFNALFAQETELTLPVGGDILPGGGLVNASQTIQESFVFSKLIPFVVTYAIRLAVALAVIALIIGGYQFLTSYGDTEKRGKAIKTVTYAIVGLIITLMAFGIVMLITSINLGANNV